MWNIKLKIRPWTTPANNFIHFSSYFPHHYYMIHHPQPLKIHSAKQTWERKTACRYDVLNIECNSYCTYVPIALHAMRMMDGIIASPQRNAMCLVKCYISSRGCACYRLKASRQAGKPHQTWRGNPARFRAIYKLPLFQASSSLYSALSRFINSLHLGDMDKPQTSAHNIMSKCEWIMRQSHHLNIRDAENQWME